MQLLEIKILIFNPLKFSSLWLLRTPHKPQTNTLSSFVNSSLSFFYLIGLFRGKQLGVVSQSYDQVVSTLILN